MSIYVKEKISVIICFNESDIVRVRVIILTHDFGEFTTKI